MNETKIILKKGKEKSLERFHPWVFSGAIDKINGNIENGTLISVYANSGKYLAKGHYNNGSIAIRLLTFKEEDINSIFYTNRIKSALLRRKAVNLVENASTNAFRLIHGEGDELPGLIIDYYDNHIIIQCHSIGMHQQIDAITEALKNNFPEVKTIYDKSKETLPKEYSVSMENKFLLGNTESAVILENGHQFEVNWITGQKTGFFIDQRDSRKLLGEYARGKKILNTFCYSGGFSVYALQQGASEVHSLDSSKKAIDLTEKNVELNQLSEKHKSIVADAIPYLNQMQEQYDIIVLDPPAFAKHLGAKKNAIQGYRRLNEAAIKQLNSGGILFTFSCSQAIDKETFRSIIFSAAANTGKQLKILNQLHQSPDHPINIFHPEGEYLKGLALIIE